MGAAPDVAPGVPLVGPPVGPLDQARGAMETARTALSVVREAKNLFSEFRPYLEAFLPAPVVSDHPKDGWAPPVGVPMPADGRRARVVAAPEPADPAPGPTEKEAAALEEIKKILGERMAVPDIVGLAVGLAPFAMTDKTPALGDALVNHSEGLLSWLSGWSEAEVRASAIEAVGFAKPAEWPVIRAHLAAGLGEPEKAEPDPVPDLEPVAEPESKPKPAKKAATKKRTKPKKAAKRAGGGA